MANKIDIKTVDEIAHLARLEFDAESKQEIVKDMNRMLTFIDKLGELDTENVEPLIYMTQEKNIFDAGQCRRRMNLSAMKISAKRKM